MADFLHFINSASTSDVSSTTYNGGINVNSKVFISDSVSSVSGLNSIYDNRFTNQESYDGSLYIGYPTSGTFPLISYSSANFNLREINNIQTSSGICNIDLCINNVVIGGFSGVTVNSTPQYVSSTSDNFIRMGDRLSVHIYNISGAVNLECSIFGGR